MTFPKARTRFSWTRVGRAVGLAGLTLALVLAPARGQDPDPCAGTAQNLPPAVTLERVAAGLQNPVDLADPGDRSGRLFIVEQTGVIRVLRDGTLEEVPFLDLRERVRFGGERGLLGLAFHPDYAINGRFFVNYTARPDGRTVVAEYRVSDDPNVAAREERVVLEVAQPFPNHNGGQLRFGPDGFLYIGLGDGGAGGDPLGHGQNLATLLGALLRLDVDGQAPYAVPADNPFVGEPGVRAEIYAYGLRNPWRFAFDRCDGRLFLADVGQDRWEEVNLIQAGGNYGWNVMEGAHCFRPASGCAQEGLELPIAEYGHDEGFSITGGFVYRGQRIPELRGRYVFGDFGSGRVWALNERAPGRWEREALLRVDFPLSAFGEDEAGELYLLEYGGAIHRLVPAP